MRRNLTLETYTFTIQYASNKDRKPSAVGISLEGLDDEQEMLVNNAGRDLHNTLQAITELCESLPELPGRHSMLCLNAYTDSVKLSDFCL